jgi:hypothetical protein
MRILDFTKKTFQGSVPSVEVWKSASVVLGVIRNTATRVSGSLVRKRHVS